MGINQIGEKNCDSIQHCRIVIPVLLVAFVLALGLRIHLARRASFTSVGDAAFYFKVAQNIVEGKGLQVDHIWHFYSQPDSITHPAHDRWLPLTSLIVAASFLCFGVSVFSALVPSILAGMAWVLLAFFISRRYSPSQLVWIGSCLVALFLPACLDASLRASTAAFATLCNGASLLMMIKGRTNPRDYLIAAGLAGLGYLIRQDAIFLAPAVAVSVLCSGMRARKSALYLLLCGLVFLFVASPLFLHNYKYFGGVFAPNLYKQMLFTSPAGLHSVEVSWDIYRAWGIKNIVQSKIVTMIYNLRTGHEVLGDFLWAFVLIETVEVFFTRQRKHLRYVYLPLFVYLALGFVFYSCFDTFGARGGSYYKSVMPSMLFFIVVSVTAMRRYICSDRLFWVVISFLVLRMLVQGTASTASRIEADSQIGAQLQALKHVLQQEGVQKDEAVIMTRAPLEVNLATGYKALQIPHDHPDKLDVFYTIARKYKATHLLLGGPLTGPELPVLESIYAGSESDPHLELLTDVPGTRMRLFRISSYGPASVQSGPT